MNLMAVCTDDLTNPFGLSASSLRVILDHTHSESPKESCGLIVRKPDLSGNRLMYVPCENVAADPINHFEVGSKLIGRYMATNALRAVVHSHPNAEGLLPFASKADMEGQTSSGVPWAVVHQNGEGVWSGPWFWGDQLRDVPLIGRPFVSGVYDCYSLVRSYYRSELSIDIPDAPREPVWWETDTPNFFTEGFEDAGFKKIGIDELEPGDGVIGSVASDGRPNHCGIYLGNNLLLHHLWNRVSRRDPMSNWSRYITHALRYEG